VSKFPSWTGGEDASGGVVDKLMLAQRSLFASVLDLPPRLRQQARRPFLYGAATCPGGEICWPSHLPQDYSDRRFRRYVVETDEINVFALTVFCNFEKV